MGIPHLQALLQPYATPIIFPATATSSTSSTDASNIEKVVVIIDGPALCYHAYAIATAKQRKQLLHTTTTTITRRNNGPVDSDALAASRRATPSYHAIAGALVGWLDALSGAHAVRIGALLFDGALPAWKTGVRRERMRAYVRTLDECRYVLADLPSQEQQELGVSPDDQDESSFCFADLYDFRAPAAREIKFPPPAFLIPAMLEALRKSRYARVTQIVPGEADPFCAAEVRRCGGIVITSDSDLLIHNLGPQGRVILFREFGVGEKDGLSVITAKYYWPSKLATRFALQTLLPLGFAIKKKKARLKEHLVRAAHIEQTPTDEYEEFSREYNDLNSNNFAFTGNKQLNHAMQNVDKAVSELASQLLTPEQAGQKANQWDLYLPLIHEDPRRVSAWSYGMQIRQTACSLLASSSTRQTGSIVEHVRKGNQVGETRIDIVDRPTLAENMQQLLDVLHSSLSLFSSLQPAPSWRELGLFWLMQTLQQDDKPVPRRSSLQALYQSNVKRSWAQLHYSAQFQALLYSWRLLHQCISLHTALSSASGYVCPDAAALSEAMTAVDGATLAAMFDPISLLQLDRTRLDAVLAVIVGALNVELQAEPEASKKKRKKKKKQMVGIKTSSQAAPTRTANLFEILALD